ncbi:MAG: HD domain-containing protein [Flavobacteriia bacterium]|nr:HD domain-containing protein [Flavobacteriia bacterium]
MKDLIQKAEQYVFDLFKDKLNSNYTYHNFLHAQFVVSKIKELIEAEKTNEEESDLLVIAAWFHDAGYIDGAEGHEIRSAEIAGEFLTKNGVGADQIEKVKQYILATHLANQPQTKNEMIIRDADCAHVGDAAFEQLSALLKNEVELTTGKEIKDSEWNLRNYEFLLNVHRFYTDYAQLKWQPVKLKNVLKVREQIDNLDEIKEKERLKKSKIEKLDKPDRGIDTLFRVTINNHTRLSEIADSKANILLSVNAIIISIALSTLLPKLGSPKNEYLIMPTLTMLFVSVICIIFAIMATKPNVTRMDFTTEDVRKRKINILFFGNFNRLSLPDYEDAMEDLMSDRKYLYGSLSRDLYYLGKVLERKYKLLRITYVMFMIGTILTVIAFIWAFSENTDYGWLSPD